jgi:CheY-like chemotaxis protein
MMDEVTPGSYVARALRQHPVLATVPIILLTSVRVKHPWWGVEKDDERLPVDIIVDKPVSPERLIAEAKRLCGIANNSGPVEV